MALRFQLCIFLVLLSTLSLSYVVKEEQVTFYLYTRNSEEIQITDSNFKSIDVNKVFHFIIHGWISNHENEWVQSMTEAYLEQDDCNVIQVDWREPALEPVYVSAYNTKDVGVFVGKFISKLINELKVNPTNVNLVGHSFGSQIVGFAGKQVIEETGVKIGRIIVTDPARRPFESSIISKNDKVNSEDALVVVGIHSDAGKSGFLNPLGTVDFYPNGGLDPQPGCEDSDNTHGCSHNIVNDFLIEAIKNPTGFTSTKCDSYENYLNGVCADGDKVNMGGNLENVEGVFYFETNPEPPYSKG